MNKIQKGDDVIILTGKDKGRQGAVLQRVSSEYFVVDGINVAKKATKPNPMVGQAGGLLEKLMPIHVSNIALFNSASGKADRAGFKNVDGKKIRVFKSDGKVVKG